MVLDDKQDGCDDPHATHIVEINRLKAQLERVTNKLHSQQELIVSVRQNLIRRILTYLHYAQPLYNNGDHNAQIMAMSEDLHNLIAEQHACIVRIRQDKLKQLVDMNASRAASRPASQATSRESSAPHVLQRQKSRSTDDLLRIVPAPGSSAQLATAPIMSRVAPSVVLRRSATTRAPKHGGRSSVTRSASLRHNTRLLSVDDHYAQFSGSHMSRKQPAGKATEPQRTHAHNYLSMDSGGNMVLQHQPASGSVPESEGSRGDTANTSRQSDMLSSNVDFVDVDELIKFTHDHPKSGLAVNRPQKPVRRSKTDVGAHARAMQQDSGKPVRNNPLTRPTVHVTSSKQHTSSVHFAFDFDDASVQSGIKPDISKRINHNGANQTNTSHGSLLQSNDVWLNDAKPPLPNSGLSQQTRDVRRPQSSDVRRSPRARKRSSSLTDLYTIDDTPSLLPLATVKPPHAQPPNPCAPQKPPRTVHKPARSEQKPSRAEQRPQWPHTTGTRSSLCRSASDHVMHAAEERRVREDMRVVSELEEELREVDEKAKALRLQHTRQILNLPNYMSKPSKASTLPVGMTGPGFGKKKKCAIM